MKKKQGVLCTVGVSLLSFIIVIGIYNVFFLNDYHQERERYHYIAENEIENIITTIDSVMVRSYTLRAMVQDHDGDTEFFDGIAAEMCECVKEETGISLKNIALAPDGVVTKVYPPEGNEELFGFDFMDTSRPGNAEAVEAYEKGNTVLTNPFELVQGGKGIAGRTPVIISGNGQERLWGLVTVTMDYNNLMEVLKLDGLKDMGISYELSYIDDGENGVVMQSRGKIGSSPVEVQFYVRNLKWRLSVMPESGWINYLRVVLAVFTAAVIACFAGLLASFMLRLRATNRTLLTISNTDALTRFYNRRAYEADIMSMPEIPQEKEFCYISADLNGLKAVNDSLGHAAGDEIIQGAADCLRRCLGGFGKLYRTGGDEFVGIIYADENKLHDILADLKETVSEWSGNLVGSLSLSVGSAAKAEHPDSTVMELSKIADKRMYEEKSSYYKSRGIDRRGQQTAYNALCGSYIKVLSADLSRDSYRLISCGKDEPKAPNGHSEKLSDLLSGFAQSGLVHPEDNAEYLRRTEIGNIRRALSEKGSFILHYRGLVGGEYKKVMLEIVPAKDYSAENEAVFVFVKAIE